MKIQHIILATIGMFSSALTWAAADVKGSLVNPIYSGAWENASDAAIPPKGHAIAKLQAVENKLDGSVLYNIADENHDYFFKIKIADAATQNGQYCIVEDANLIGPEIYQVSATGRLNDDGETVSCDVNVTGPQDNPDYNPHLVLESFQYLQYENVKQVKAFTSKQGKIYMAVVVAGGNKGVHILEWKNPDVGFVHVQQIALSDVQKIEFFAGEEAKTTEYLFIAINNGSTSSIDIWYTNGANGANTFMKDNQFSGTLPTQGVSDIKHFKDGSKDFLVITNSGSSYWGYNHYSTVHQWEVGQGNFKPAMLHGYPTYGAQGAEVFVADEKTWLAFANKNDDQNYDVDSSVWNFNNSKAGYYGVNDGTKAETLGAMAWESINVGTQAHLIVTNSNGSSNADHYDTVIRDFNDGSFSGDFKIATPKVNNWKAIQVNGEHYILPGFISKPSAGTTEVYGWCNGDENAQHWCYNALPQNSNMRYHKDSIPNPDNVDFMSAGWESIKIDGRVYVIRFDNRSGNSKSVQVLKATTENL